MIISRYVPQILPEHRRWAALGRVLDKSTRVQVQVLKKVLEYKYRVPWLQTLIREFI